MAPVKEVDRKAIAEALSGVPEVVAAYLYGSHARGEAGPLSDVDVGVLLDERMDREERFRLQLKLFGTVEDAIGGGDVDVKVLNDVPQRLAHEMLKGDRLFARDLDVVLAFEVRVMDRVLDRRVPDDRYDEIFLERASS